MNLKPLLFSNSVSAPFASLAPLVLRLSLGFGMLFGHGLGKLKAWETLSGGFPDPLGVGHAASLALAIFAEVFCSLLLALGLATRAALIPLLITMGVAAFVIHGGDPLFIGPGVAKAKEPALLYLVGYLAVFFTGPGRYSLDRSLAGK